MQRILVTLHIAFEASLIGELTCVLTALVLVPALLAVGKRRPTRALSPAEPTEYGV